MHKMSPETTRVGGQNMLWECESVQPPWRTASITQKAKDGPFHYPEVPHQGPWLRVACSCTQAQRNGCNHAPCSVLEKVKRPDATQRSISTK
jgi:hypothetical protein